MPPPRPVRAAAGGGVVVLPLVPGVISQARQTRVCAWQLLATMTLLGSLARRPPVSCVNSGDDDDGACDGDDVDGQDDESGYEATSRRAKQGAVTQHDTEVQALILRAQLEADATEQMFDLRFPGFRQFRDKEHGSSNLSPCHFCRD
jgi:hypothetical protein